MASSVSRGDLTPKTISNFMYDVAKTTTFSPKNLLNRPSNEVLGPPSLPANVFR